ncbi:MAG TPA: acyltransferase [Terriglobales bacterium]|nr:acyltransferase [Terriglobales bacterium]
MKGDAPNQLLRRKMPELDTLRGVAILAVVFYHGLSQCDTTGLPGIARAVFAASRFGWLGVNLFFVLSGFLITGILLDSKGTPRYYKSFYVRRALRILPAYLLLLLLLLLLPRIGIVEGRISWSFVGLSLIYLSNVTNFFGVAMQYGPLWSLAVEEQFYLLWPAAVRNLSQRALAFCALAVFLGCPLLRAIAFAYGHPAEVWYTWMVADGLASGSLLAISSRTLLTDRRSMKWFSALCMTASLLLISLAARFGTLSPVPPTTLLGASLRWTLFNVLFTGMLGTALLLGASGWAQIVRRPVLQFFGEISYGLYLIHTLVFEVTGHFVAPVAMRLARFRVQGDAPLPLILIRFLVGAVAATLIAFLSRRYFEEPFLKLKNRWAASTVEFALLRNKAPAQPMPVQPMAAQPAMQTSRAEAHCIPGDSSC